MVRNNILGIKEFCKVFKHYLSAFVKIYFKPRGIRQINTDMACFFIINTIFRGYINGNNVPYIHNAPVKKDKLFFHNS